MNQRTPVWVARFDGGYEARVYDVGLPDRPVGRFFITAEDGRILLSEKVDLLAPDRLDIWERMSMLAIDLYQAEVS